MRRRSFNRPKEKLRGIKRRLKAFDKWADSFKGYFPLEQANEKFWNCKISIIDRMVNLPTTNKVLQRHCVIGMLRAAKFIEAAKPERLKNAKVTVLITYPNMFDSELCIFLMKRILSNFLLETAPI